MSRKPIIETIELTEQELSVGKRGKITDCKGEYQAPFSEESYDLSLRAFVKWANHFSEDGFRVEVPLSERKVGDREDSETIFFKVVPVDYYPQIHSGKSIIGFYNLEQVYEDGTPVVKPAKSILVEDENDRIPN